ncbi:MAG: hypothetical protein J0H89_10805 [Rhizobiales bacterium]|nr:hypothetical protein [Hyphomicrobiales bacterium]
MTEVNFAQLFDPEEPSRRQIAAVEAAVSRLIGHPIKRGSGTSFTKLIMGKLRTATELDAAKPSAGDVIVLPEKIGAA